MASSYKELIRKANARSGSQPATNTGGKPSYADLLKQANQRRFDNAVRNVDDSYISTFENAANDFLSNSKTAYEGMNWKNSSQMTANMRSAKEDLDFRQSVIRSWLEKNKSSIGDDRYRSVSDVLDAYSKDSSRTMRSLDDAVKFYSQWETEDAYNKDAKNIEYQRKYQGKTYDAIQRILADMDDGEEKKWLRANQYGFAKNNANFDSYSGYSSTALDGKFEKMWSKYGMGYGDLTYEYINNQNGIRDEIRRKSYGYSADTKNAPSFVKNNYDQMTPDEVSIYNYYYSKYGKEKAEDYLYSIESTLEARANGETVKNFSSFADKHPYLASAVSVGTSVGSGAEYLGDILEYGKDVVKHGAEYLGDILKYGKDGVKYVKDSKMGENELSLMTNAVRGTVMDKVDWEIGNWDAFDFLYGNAMSGVDSLVASMAPGKIGGFALGLSAAAQGTNDALQRGMSSGQAFWNGLFNGVFEWLFESLSIGNFKSLQEVAPDSIKTIFKNLSKSMLVNATEEMATEIANIGYDTLINGEFANYTKEDLKNGKWKDAVLQVLEAGAGGALMGVGFAGIGNAIGYFSGRKTDTSSFSNATADNVEAVTDESSAVDDKMSATENAPSLESLSEKYGNYAAEMRNAFQDGQDVQEYDRSFKTVYDMAKEGYRAEDVQRTDAASYLNESQVKTAYDAGVAASIENDTAQSKAYNDTSRTNPASSSDANAGAEGKFTPKNSTEQRAAREFTEDGKTVLINTGEEVTVKEIASKKDGQFQLRLEDGRTVDADNVSFGSQDLAVVYDAMAQMDINPSAADILVKNYIQDGELSGAEYAQQVKNAYRFGQYSIPEIELSRSDMTNRLSEHQRNQAYKLGKVFGETTAQQKETDIRQKQASAKSQKSSETVAKKSSVGKTEAVGKVHFDRKGRTFSDAQETGLKTMEQLSRLLGVEFHVFESYEKDGKRVYLDENGVEKSAPNGKYDTSTGHIYIDLNAGINADGTILFTVSHELTHFIRQWSPVKFDTLAEAVFKMAYEKKNIHVSELVREQQAKALRNNRDISFDEAYEEVVADSMESILTSGKVLEFMAEVKQQDKSLWQKIKEWFKDLAEDIRKMVKAYEWYKPDSPEGRAIASMEGILPILEGFYEDALLDAAENYKEVGNGVKTASDSEAKVSIRENEDASKQFSIEITEWAKEGQNAETQFVLGSTGTVLQGLGAIESDIYMNGDKISTILKEHPEITLSEIQQIPKILSDPILILKSRNAGRGKPQNTRMVMFGSVKAQNGQPVMAIFDLRPVENHFVVNDMQKVTSAYTKTTDAVSFVKNSFTMYADKKRTASLLRTIGFHMPIELLQSGFIGSITYNKQNVNLFGEKFADVFRTQDDVKLSDRDSDGRTLTEEQKSYFSNSKVRDNDGNLLVMYHGTPNGDFTKFRSGSYFTQNPEYAALYQNPVASMLRVKKNAESPKNYQVYLNIKNPFDTRNRKERRIFMQEYYRQWGTGAPLSDSGLPDWTDGIDLQEFIEEMGYDYDGLILDEGATGGYGEEVKSRGFSYVVFSPEQVKNVDNITPTDDPDIRYSDRDPLQEKAVQALRKENDKLREDVSNLKEMVKLQKKVTGGKMMKPSSVEASARVLKKSADATGDTKELAKLLGDFYSYIANGEELTWEGVKEAAKPAADWLWNNRKHTIDEYSAEILKELRTRGISFSEDQKSEAAMTHDTFANYRKALFGSVKITNDGMPLDEAWHELSGMYPDVFSEDTNSSDMPRELVDIVDRLRSSNGTYIGYDEIMARQSLIRDVYDSYWNVSTLYTFADAKQKEITLLKIKHKNKMDEVLSDHREEVQQLRTDKQNSVKAVRQRHKKDELRRKIRKTVSELNKLLIHGNKKKNIKEGMKDFAATALASAEILFSDNISNEDMLLNGIGTQVDAKENRLIEETLTLLQKRKDLYNLDAASQEIEDVVFTGESDSYALRMKESQKLDSKISENMRELESVFERERNRLNEATVSGILENLAEAYKDLGSSDALYIRSATDERVYQHLMKLKDKIGGATVRDMTVEQLKAVSDAYTMVLTTIRNANKAFTDGRSIQADAEQMASEFKSRNIPDKKLGIAAKRLLDSVGWNYEKLHYALDRIDSPTLSKLFGKLADSENITMRDVQEAKAYQLEMVEKYHYNDWKINQKMDHDFVDNTGKEFRLTLGELMALYAYSRREDADRHIEYGGFTFGETALTDPNPASTYKLTAAQLKKITGMLTQEQRAFAEAMQKYLSETMGDKGNEVSMKLYGIKLFGEEIYFPLHIAGEYQAQAQDSKAKEAAGFQSMSNAGFTHARNKESIAPIVLEDFMSVWADHVNEMSRYHGAVPALEDIRRVMNYSVYNDSANDSMAVEAAMTNAFGKQAVRYFDNLYREANSGAITDRLDAPQKKMLSMFRKNAVAYSLSVLIQQPASIYRARMEVDRKYFGRNGFFTLTGAGLRIFNRKKWNESYAEMMKYAPGVSMAKEIGGFDTSTGNSIRSYLLDTGKSFVQSMKNDTLKYKAKYVMDFVDNNPLANLPNAMDKVAWIEMWEACKRETVAKNPNMRPGSEVFLQKVGQRFTEVIRATQVYDSMFSKSPMLKTKNLFVQSAVSFMNEPNTVANMAEAAIRDMTRGNWKKAGKTGAALVTSIVATRLLASMVYAIRDDDEDETLLEKYVSAVAGGLIDDVTVFNYIPFARDVWSVVQGYDVERADMAIVADAVNAVRKLAKMSEKDTSSMTEEELEAWDMDVMDCQWAVAETLSPLLRIPLKNIRRDILAVFNAVKIIGLDKERESTVLSIQHAVEDAIWKGSKSNCDRLYEALVSGDREYAKRLRDNYKNESAYHTAVRKGLRDNDSRIWEAAVAWNSNDMATYFRIAKEIKGEKRFIQDDIVLAIRAEANAMEEKKQSSSGKVNGYFTNEKFGAALGQNNISMADTIRNDLIDTAVANGKTRVEAEESVRSTARTQLKQLYANGTITGANAEKMLVKYGGMETEEAKAMTKAWGWMNQNPNSEATVEQVEAYQRPLEGLNRSVADMGIGMDIYLNEKKVVDSFESDKDENGKTIAYSRVNKAFPYINRLNLTREQKTALAVACGWSYKTVMENKLW